MMKKKMTIMGRLGTVHLTWRRYLAKGYGRLGVTLKQAFLLRQLSSRDFLYPSQIADMLFCDRPTATVIIRNMEKQGWVEKERDPDNKKMLRVMITRDGLKKYVEISESENNPEKRVLPSACFTPEELETFEEGLKKLQGYLDSQDL